MAQNNRSFRHGDKPSRIRSRKCLSSPRDLTGSLSSGWNLPTYLGARTNTSCKRSLYSDMSGSSPEDRPRIAWCIGKAVVLSAKRKPWAPKGLKARARRCRASACNFDGQVLNRMKFGKPVRRGSIGLGSGSKSGKRKGDILSITLVLNNFVMSMVVSSADKSCYDDSPIKMNPRNHLEGLKKSDRDPRPCLRCLLSVALAPVSWPHTLEPDLPASPSSLSGRLQAV